MMWLAFSNSVRAISDRAIHHGTMELVQPSAALSHKTPLELAVDPLPGSLFRRHRACLPRVLDPRWLSPQAAGTDLRIYPIGGGMADQPRATGLLNGVQRWRAEHARPLVDPMSGWADPDIA